MANPEAKMEPTKADGAEPDRDDDAVEPASISGKSKVEPNHKEFKMGEVLFKQGAKGGDLFFIKKGLVELKVRDGESGNERTVATVKERSVLGTMSFLEGEPRSATAVCKTDVTCVVVTQTHREKLLKQVPPWFKVLLKDLSGNLRLLNEQHVRTVAENEILHKRVKIMKARLGEDKEAAETDPESAPEGEQGKSKAS